MVGTNIIEWGYCLDDCPHETPEIVCRSDPPLTPTLVFDEDGMANFTTDYDFGLDLTNKEVSGERNEKRTATHRYHVLLCIAV